MKVALAFLVSVLLTISTYAQTFKRKFPDVEMKTVTGYADGAGVFYPTSSDFLVIQERGFSEDLRPYLKKKGNDWLSFETSSLGLDFKEGDEVQYVDYKTGILKKFIFPKKVTLALMKNELYRESSSYHDYYGSFYILLREAGEEVNHPSQDKEYNPGIGYIGNKYKLKPSVVKEPAFKDVEASDEGLKRILDSYFELVGNGIDTSLQLKNVKKGEADSFYFYQIQATDTSKEGDWGKKYAVILQINEKKFLNFNNTWDNPQYSPFADDVKFGNFIEGADLVFLLGEGGMHSCYQIGILKDGKLTFERMSCDSGGC